MIVLESLTFAVFVMGLVQSISADVIRFQIVHVIVLEMFLMSVEFVEATDLHVFKPV